MPRSATSLFLVLLTVLAMLALTGPASANKLDLALARFIDCKTPLHCEPRISEYEQFMAEYAFGLSPKILAPAETLGYSGFYLGLEGTLTPVPGEGKNPRWYDGTAPADETPGMMFVPAVHVRKGLPWSFELGASLNYLAQSELVGLGGEVKWSLFEGYRHGFRGAMPDLAARGSVLRVLGESDVDMTIIGVDGSISYPFGIGGMISLTPYGGFQYLWTIIRIEPLVYRDEEGHDDCDDPSSENCWANEWDGDGSQKYEFHQTFNGLYDTTGLSGPNLERMRLFLGFRIRYEMLSITFEGAWGLAAKWDTAISKPTGGAANDPVYVEGYNDQRTAEVGHQFQFSGGVGMDF